MWSQRNLLVLTLGVAAVGIAVAQASGTLRWRSSPLGLQAGPAGNELRSSCGPSSLSCDATATVPLYTNRQATRSLSMQLGNAERSTLPGLAANQGLSLNLIGRAGILPDVGLYGRVGTTLSRPPGLALANPDSAGGGVSYGVGLRWDFSRKGSAVLGFDSYDVRGAAGDSRDVRATSLGLQWRY